MLRIKKGNQNIIDVAIRDADGNLITDLNTAVEITYMIKSDPDDDNTSALVTKTLTGGGIVIDTPSTGYVRITLEPTDTSSVEAGQWYHGLQINYSSTNIQEIWLKTDQNFDTDRVEIVRDIIR